MSLKKMMMKMRMMMGMRTKVRMREKGVSEEQKLLIRVHRSMKRDLLRCLEVKGDDSDFINTRPNNKRKRQSHHNQKLNHNLNHNHNHNNNQNLKKNR